MIEVLSAGLYSTIQDQGRFGLRNMGVPTSGAMDMYSARLANALLNNDGNSAVMEVTYTGPTLSFNKDTFITVTGARCLIKLDGKSVKSNTVMAISAGSILKIGRVLGGIRAYIGIAGGFVCPVVLNSRSFYQGITPTSQIQKGDRFEIISQCQSIVNRASVKVDRQHFESQKINVTKGPEFKRLDRSVKHNLFERNFTVSSQSNRMAYKLEKSNHLETPLRVKEIISSCVQTGTIQLTPSGELIVLMRDCQTTGGYARVLQLTDNSINRLAQKRAGQTIVFNLNE